MSSLVNLDLSQPQMCSLGPPAHICVGLCIYVGICACSIYNTAGASRSTQTIAEEMAPVRARPQSTAITFFPLLYSQAVYIINVHHHLCTVLFDNRA